MKIGVVYPQTEYGSDPGAIKEYAQTVEALGFTHILAYDHILGANPERPGGWRGPYTYQSTFQEPFILFSFMAGITQRIQFTTSIIILPQRQTALVAKQAANLDVLSGGRLRLGVGLGWNQVEYEALNQDFHNRGRRIEEQVTVMRELWTQPLVTFKGRWHNIPDAGLNPLPIQRPIPVWFGGQADPVLRRTARMGDGWMPNHRNPDDAKRDASLFKQYMEEAGRSMDGFGIEARLYYGDGNPSVWGKHIQSWQALGANHFSINTMRCGFTSPQAHLDALKNFAEQMGIGK